MKCRCIRHKQLCTQHAANGLLDMRDCCSAPFYMRRRSLGQLQTAQIAAAAAAARSSSNTAVHTAATRVISTISTNQSTPPAAAAAAAGMTVAVQHQEGHGYSS
jgi:hypothetical protein